MPLCLALASGGLFPGGSVFFLRGTGIIPQKMIENEKSYKQEQEYPDHREDLEEYVDIFMTTKDPETIHALLQIGIDRKNKIEQEKATKEAREADLEKYKALGNVIEKIGSKVVCDLVQ